MLGFGIGGVLGSYLQTKYKDVSFKMCPLQKASTRALIMIKCFEDIGMQFDKEAQIYLLENIVCEGKKVRRLGGVDNSAIKE